MAVFFVVLVVGVGYLLLTSGGASAMQITVGTKLSAAQIQAYASDAGFAGDDLQVAVAVALAESDGKTDAIGDPTLGGSYGLWQIYEKAHPEYAPADLMDPATNAVAAYAVYDAAGQSFTPWTTYKTGAYQKYLGAA